MIRRNITQNLLDALTDTPVVLLNGARQTAYQKKLLKALAADGQNVFSAEYAVRFRLSAASTTQKALNGLVNAGIVEKYQSTYTFDDPFFKRYLLRPPA